MRIERVDYRVVRWPIAPAGAARGRWTERTAVIVAVRADSGATGLGEAAPLPGMSIDEVDDAARACEALAARVPFAIDAAGDAIALADQTTIAPSARFAIETVLLSVLAQHGRTSIASMLAPATHTSLPSSHPAEHRGELRRAVVVDDEAEAAAAVQLGAPCLKIKAPSPADLDPVTGRVHRIARAAPGTPLRIDANRGWPRGKVATLLASIAMLPIELVEEPCPGAHELLAGALPVRIALDESLVDLDRDQLARALASPDLAALVLKPTLLGGFARCLELAAAARARGVAAIVTHTLEGPIGTAACHELARAVGGGAPAGLAPHPALVGFAGAEPIRTFTTPVPLPYSLFSGAARTEHDGDVPRGDVVWRSAILTSNRRDGTGNREAEPEPRTEFRDRSAEVIVAAHTEETVEAIRAAFAARRPIALLHAKATAEEHARQRALIDAARFEPDDAVVLFTSGSTGPSRGVVLSRHALIANAQASAWHLGWRGDDRWLACLPLAHAGGLSVVIRCMLGEKPIALGDVSLLASADAHITLASLVPAQLAQLLDDPAWRPPPMLRAVLLGGAAAPPALIEAALARGVPVLSTYGLTETFGQVATARVPGGRPVPLHGAELAAGTRDVPAPIRIRGPMLATRYLDGAPIAPELVTADLGFVEDGELHVLGRADDVIISGGENVHPTQVEAVLAATPGVRAAAAFGIHDARWGQLVAAAVAVAPAFDHARALEQWRAQLPPHARPRRLALLAELPRLPSGKVDRRALLTLATAPLDYDSPRSHVLQARE